MEGTPDDSAKWWKATAPSGESICYPPNATFQELRSCRRFDVAGRSSLAQNWLARIRVLSRHGDGHHPDSKIAVQLTRLFTRCLSHDGSILDIELLRMRASNAETWETAAQKARNKYLYRVGLLLA